MIALAHTNKNPDKNGITFLQNVTLIFVTLGRLFFGGKHHDALVASDTLLQMKAEPTLMQEPSYNNYKL